MLQTVRMGLLALGACAAIPVSGASAAVIYNQNFNSFTNGNLGSTQQITNLPVEANGTVTGITATGPGAIHAVDRSNGAGTNWAVMLYDNNVLTTAAIAGANTNGVSYTVSFDTAPAVYYALEQATAASSYLTFLVKDGSGATITSVNINPGAFPNGVTTNTFSARSFNYLGNGNGSVSLVLEDVDSDGRFGGAVDNLMIATTALAVEVPEPASIALLGAGLVGLGMIRRRNAG